jgi:hypothetical protein
VRQLAILCVVALLALGMPNALAELALGTPLP